MMKINKIFYSSHFEKQFKKLPKYIKLKAVEKEKIFRNDCFDVQLSTHKLNGVLDGFWSFSINYSYRIIFEFIDSENILFTDVGTHSIYK